MTMLWKVAGGAAAVIALLGAAAAQGGQVKERSTGVGFDALRSFPGAGGPLALTGTGVRKKFGIAKVYAFAFYVDPGVAKSGLAAWSGKPAEDLAKDAALYRALNGLKGDRAGVLHFVRDVDASAMRDAMSEAMDRGMPTDDPARKAFLALWTDAIKTGEEVVLTFSPAGAVSLVRGDKTIGTVASPALASSLLQSWLGPDPVSDDIQRGVVARLPELLE